MDLNNVTFMGSWGDLPGKVWKELSKGGAHQWCTKNYQEDYKEDDDKTHWFGKFARADNIITVDGGKKDRVTDGILFTKDDAFNAANHFINETLPGDSAEEEGVRAAYGFSVNGNALPYFMYQKYKGKSIVNTAEEKHYGLLAHIFWVQGCDGYMDKDAVGVAMADKIGKKVINDHGGYDEYLTELTRVMEADDIDGFNGLLEVYNSIESTPEIMRMKQTDIDSFKAFKSVTGGGLRRKATKRKATKPKATKRKYMKRKVTKRQSKKRRKTKRRKTKRKNTRRRRR